MIKPRFSIWKEAKAMAAGTVAIGIYENHSTNQVLHHGAGVPGGRNLIERSLDPDQSLVSRCLRGDETAWEELVRLHTRKVYALCYRFTGSGSEAQDLTQEVFPPRISNHQDLPAGRRLVWYLVSQSDP
jgi:hypothetical protein